MAAPCAFRGLLLAALVHAPQTPILAQAILFDSPTDTIEVSGQTVLGSDYTAEAWVMFCPGLPLTNAVVFQEQYDLLEDKALIVWAGGLGGTCQTPLEPSSFIVTPPAISTGVWHHVAFVYDGTEQRVYLDGALRGARAVAGDIDDSPSSAMSIGGFVEPIGGEFRGAFTGLLNSLRISGFPRYFGSSYSVPPLDMASDVATELLYTFNEPGGSATITDSSGNGHTGTLGTGFAGASMPRLGVSNCAYLGTAFCFGDGSGAACPCGNSGTAGNGCANNSNPAGANLGASGDASLAMDTVTLVGTGMPSTVVALYFQGTTQLNGGLGVPYGDGLRCAGGAIVRLGTATNVAGGSQYPGPLDPPVSVKGLVMSPGTRTYQCWYRNAAAFCTSATFNLTNGLEISWTQ